MDSRKQNTQIHGHELAEHSESLQKANQVQYADGCTRKEDILSASEKMLKWTQRRANRNNLEMEMVAVPVRYLSLLGRKELRKILPLKMKKHLWTELKLKIPSELKPWLVDEWDSIITQNSFVIFLPRRMWIQFWRIMQITRNPEEIQIKNMESMRL